MPDDSSARGQAEAALRGSEERFRQVAENAQEWIWEVDAEGRYTYSSPVVERMLGYRPEEIVGRRHFYDLLLPADRDELKRAAFQIFVRQQPFRDFVSRNLHKDGHVIWLSTSGVPVVDEHGQLAGYRGAAAEITERRKADSELRESERRFREMLKDIALVAVTLDRQGRIAFASDYLLHLTGWQSQEAIGRDWFDFFVPPEQRAQVRKVFFQLVRDGSLVPHYENEIITRQGKRRLISWHNTLLRDAGGNITGTASIGEDVTRRREAGQQLAHANALLRAIRNVDQLIVYEKDQDRLLHRVCEILIETRGYHSAWTALFLGEPLSVTVVAAAEAGLGETFAPLRERMQQGDLPRCIRRLLEPETKYGVTTEPGLVVVANPQEDCADCPLKLAHPGTRTMLARLAHGQDLLGVLAVYLPAKIPADAEEEELLSELATDVGYALHALHVEEQRRWAEDALRRSEAEYRFLFEGAPAGISITDFTGRVVTANQQVLEMLGCTLLELKELGVAAFYAHAADRTRLLEELRAQGKLTNYEVQLRRQDGSTLTALFNIQRIELAGQPAIFSAVRDISDRKRAEAALKDSEERFRRMADSIQDGLTITEAGRVVYVNDRACEIFGYAREELLQSGMYQLVATEEHERLRRFARETGPTGPAGLELEFWIRHKDGTRRLVLGRHSFAERTPGVISHYMVVTDITERKQAEAALRESEERYRNLFENSPMGIYRTTPDGGILMANPVLIWILGYSTLAELAQRNIEAEGFEPAYNRERFKEEMERAGEVRGKESAWTCRDGSTIFVRENARAVRDEAGKVLFYEGTVEDITERKRAEAALQESEEKYRNVVERANDGIVIIQGATIRYVNTRLAQWWGGSADDFVGKPFAEFIHPDGLAETTERYRRRIAGESVPATYEMTLRRKDGRPLPVEVNAGVISYEGKPADLVIVRDITERQQAEATRAADEARVRALAANLKVVNDLAFDLAAVSPEADLHKFLAERLKQMTGATIVGVSEYLPERHELVVRHLASDSALVATVNRFLGADVGKLRTVVPEAWLPTMRESIVRVTATLSEATFGAVPEPVGMLINKALGLGGLAGVAFFFKGELVGAAVMAMPKDKPMPDTEMLRALAYIAAVSLRRKRAETELRASESRIKTILSSMEDLVFAFDPDGKFSFYHAAAENELYVPPSRFVGRTYSEVMPPEVVELIAHALAANRRKEVAEIEYSLPIADKTRWFLAKLSPLLLDDEYAGSVAVVRDITERKQNEEQIHNLNLELQQRVVDLEEALKELESFSYSVSHDLRAPLRAIDGFSRILIEDYQSQLSPEGQQHLRRVRENTQHMGKLIDDLLAFSRLSRQPLRSQQVMPTPLVYRALDDLRDERKDRQVELIVQELPPCQADPALLQQVFFNLLANALKFTRTRDPAIVEVGVVQGEGSAAECQMSNVKCQMPRSPIPDPQSPTPVVTYFVKDNGVGFDMQYAEKAFGVFQRLHRAEEYEGTGVGLAIVQRIVHRHGGRVWAEAEVNKGATFYFTVPTAERKNGTAKSAKNAKGSGEPEEWNRK